MKKDSFIYYLLSDSKEVSSKRLMGIIVGCFGIIAHLTLIFSDVVFHYQAGRLAFESADSMFWASLGFLGVNAVSQGIQAWRGGKK